MTEPIFKPNEIIGNRYVVQKRLGVGAFSQVFKVLDEINGDIYALKVYTTEENQLDQIRNEFKILEGLNHENIARVYDTGILTSPQFAYFLKLEHLDSTPLKDLIKNKRVSFTKTKEITRALLDALIYLKSQNVIHRDIKPSNILVAEKGPILIDFNVSRETLITASSQVGTLPWQPPEVLTQQKWNPDNSDLYSLGVVLFEMLTGENPFRGKDAHSKETPPNPRDFNQRISESLANYVLNMIAGSPEERFGTAEIALEKLEQADWRLQKIFIPPADIVGRIHIREELIDKENYNPYLNYLLSLYSQSRKSNVGTRGLDAFSVATYVRTRLEKNLLPSILEGKYRLVIITGNAGDGKTAFIRMLENKVEIISDTTHFQRLPTQNGCKFIHCGRMFITNYDGSQDEGEKDNDEVLSEFLEPFMGEQSSSDDELTHIIAINEGRLLDFLYSHKGEFKYLHKEIINHLERGITTDESILVINLNLRAVVADDDEGNSILDQMIDRLTSPIFWEPCETCDIKDTCYVKFNIDSFTDPSYGPQIRHRFKTLFRITHLRQKLHITIRDLRSALAYIMVGIHDCDSIHSKLEDEEIGGNYLKGFYYNASFTFKLQKDRSRDRLLQSLSDVDPGQVTNPVLDSNISFVPPIRIRKFPPFDIRSLVDLDMLSAMFEDIQRRRIEHGTSAYLKEGTIKGLIDDHQFLHTSLRRKYFFERVDEDWLSMLPYKKFVEFYELLSSPSEKDLLRTRNELIQAISLSEGFQVPNIGEGHLILRTSQEKIITIKSFRRFDIEKFVCFPRTVSDTIDFIEYISPYLIFDYEPVEGIRLEIDLDLFEMLYRIRSGFIPSLNELQGSFINLLIFKHQLSNEQYDEVLLIEDEISFYRVQKTDDNILRMEKTLGG